MKYLIAFLAFFLSPSLHSKEAYNYLCHVRGYEIIFPYEEAIDKIKKTYKNLSY